MMHRGPHLRMFDLILLCIVTMTLLFAQRQPSTVSSRRRADKNNPANTYSAGRTKQTTATVLNAAISVLRNKKPNILALFPNMMDNTQKSEPSVRMTYGHTHNIAKMQARKYSDNTDHLERQPTSSSCGTTQALGCSQQFRDKPWILAHPFDGYCHAQDIGLYTVYQNTNSVNTDRPPSLSFVHQWRLATGKNITTFAHTERTENSRSAISLNRHTSSAQHCSSALSRTQSPVVLKVTLIIDYEAITNFRYSAVMSHIHQTYALTAILFQSPLLHWTKVRSGTPGWHHPTGGIWYFLSSKVIASLLRPSTICSFSREVFLTI